MRLRNCNAGSTLTAEDQPQKVFHAEKLGSATIAPKSAALTWGVESFVVVGRVRRFDSSSQIFIKK
jgi:hypothetical protein